MSLVLRKKIEAASGMPPSLLRNKTFWSKPISVLAAWIIEVLDEASAPRLDGRRVMAGKLVPDVDPDGTTFLFQADSHTGISAIILGADFVNYFASRRLDCTIDEAKDVSELFKRLALEDAVMRLYGALQNALEIADEYVDPRAAIGHTDFETRSRYLVFKLFFKVEAGTFDMHFVLNYEAIRRAQKRGFTGGASRAVRNSPQVLRDTINATELTVTAVLDDLHLCVGDCSRFEVGNVLPLEGAELSRLRLIANTMSGKSEIATGELGVWKTNRALKLHSGVPQDFARDFTG